MMLLLCFPTRQLFNYKHYLFVYLWIITLALCRSSSLTSVSRVMQTSEETEHFTPVCYQCIERQKFNIQVILHGSSLDEHWIRVQKSMEQVAESLHMNVNIHELTPEGLTGEELAELILTEAEEATKDGGIAYRSKAAFIVSIPDEMVEFAIQEVSARIPIFALNSPHQTQQIGLQAVLEQDNTHVGQEAAHAFVNSIIGNNSNSTGNNTTSSSRIANALFIQSALQPAALNVDQLQGFEEVLLQHNPNVNVDTILVHSADQLDEVERSIHVDECNKYQAILIADATALPVVERALNNCANNNDEAASPPQVGATFVNSDIYDSVRKSFLSFAIDPQIHLQASLATLLATASVTTGQNLVLPGDKRQIGTGSKLITQTTIPTYAYQSCQAESFPVCQDSNGMNSNLLDSVTLPPATTGVSPSANDNNVDCTLCKQREDIWIAGVLHGISSHPFWQPLYRASKQAAYDMGIHLEMIEHREEQHALSVDQMASQIHNKCDLGIDALFITIPSNKQVLIDAIEHCLSRNIPVISINSGYSISQKLGLTHHIGMDDYQAGYEAGERLIAAGIQQGYCLNHVPYNHAAQDRCRGFADSLADGKVLYTGQINVSLDSNKKYELDVETTIGGGLSPDDDWEGIGLLSCGASQIPLLREVIRKHPKALVGTFDTNEDVYQTLRQHRDTHDNWLLFAIDQQPSIQGSLPVYLLTYLIQTSQTLSDFYIETGPNFVTHPTHHDACMEQNFFAICPYHGKENMNFISDGLMSIKYLFFSINAFLCILAGAWTIKNRDEYIVRVSQPKVLFFVIFGCLISSLSILTEGIQTGYRYVQHPLTGQLTDIENPDVRRVDHACMASQWLFTMGFAITFSMLFAKIKRVRMIYRASLETGKGNDKVQQHRKGNRPLIGFKDAVIHVSVILFVDLLLLTLWQFRAPYRWRRDVTQINDYGYPVESFGYCDSDHNIFQLVLFLFQMVLLIYLLVLCWQTKSFDDNFAESSYISLSILFITQVTFLIVPIVFLVEDDTDVEFFVFTSYYFLVNFIVLVLLFIPKMINLRNIRKNNNVAVKKKTVPLGALTQSRWDEAVDIINELLEEESDTYRHMTEEQRDRLFKVKVLLLKGVQGKESKLQFIPADLMKKGFIETKRKSGGKRDSSAILTYRPKRGVRLDNSVHYVLREFGGINMERRNDTRSLSISGSSHMDDSRSQWFDEASTVDLHDPDDTGTGIGSYHNMSRARNIDPTFQLSDDESEEALNSNFHVPEEFYELSQEAKLTLFRLLSWTCIKSWDYNIFDLAKASGGHPLLFMGYAILGSPFSLFAMGQECGAIQAGVTIKDLNGYHFVDDPDLRIPLRKLCNYLRVIEKDYNSANPYHNEIHAADVLQSLHVLIQMKGNIFRTSNEELFSILLAAVVHDVNHPGENNAFQINCSTNLAIVYNDISVLENRHAAHAFMKMSMESGTNTDLDSSTSSVFQRRVRGKSGSDNNLLCNVKKDMLVSIRKRVIDAVLHTDMTKHFESVEHLKALVLAGEIGNDEESAWKVLEYMLHLADISNPAKRKNLALLWTDRCLEEFFSQGDKEKRLGLPISPNCDRKTTKKPNSQIGFISFVIKPAYEVLAQIIPSVKDQIVKGCIEANLKYWEAEKEKQS